MTIKVLIVDDEPLAREAVSLRLKNRPPFEVCGEAASGEEALALAQSHKPNVIFLDIDMPEMSGIETARHLCALGPQNIVFVTAYDDFAVDAFRVNAVDYLLKPIKDEQFTATLLRLTARINARESASQNKRLIEALEDIAPNELATLAPAANNNNTNQLTRRIAVKDGLTTKLLEIGEIESVVSGKDYICIKVGEDVLVHRCTMKKFVETLPDTFVRCHRSHTVNMSRVTGFDQTDTQMELVCASGDRHPVSRRYRARVKKHLSSISAA